MSTDLRKLIAGVDAVLTCLDEAVAAHREAIEAVADVHRSGAENLVRYAALRQLDLRDLQNDLLDLAVTSLATTEADVLAKLQAARHILVALSGDVEPFDLDRIDRALDTGDAVLDANALSLFGPQRPDRPTRIMVTLPSEAAGDADLVRGFVASGMDVARINCAHDGPDAWARMVGHVRQAGTEAGRPLAICMDVAGPKLRTGPICEGPRVGRARVRRGPDGATIAPARLWLLPVGTDAVPEPVSTPAGRPALTAFVDPRWLSPRKLADIIALRDNRGLHREFDVTVITPDGVLAAGPRSAYIAEGTTLHCGDHTAIATGIPALPQKLDLKVGDRLVLTTDLAPVAPPAPGRTARIGCSLPAAVAALSPGDPVHLDDGAIDGVVESTVPDAATVLITRTKPGGQHLGAEKGINLPATLLPMPALTALDESQLPFIAAHADILDVSFIRSVADVDRVLTALAGAGAEHLGLVLKIETVQGFEALPSILLAAMRHTRIGVMIARGDLAVEVGYERLAEVPRQILSLCEAAHIPTIWATQVLETMALTGQPSRAEITDAAAAQRAECVMLNKGPHIRAAITELDDILERMGEVQRKSRTLLRRIHSWDGQ